MRNVHRCAGLLVLMTALGLASACGGKTINHVLADPSRYRNEEVTLSGKVIDSYSIAGRGAYHLEDGSGRLIGEAPSLHQFAEQAARAAVRGGRSFIARITLTLCAIRLTIEEKIEPIFEESQELLVRFAPQIAAFV